MKEKKLWGNINAVVALLVLLFMLVPIIVIFVNSFNSSQFFSFPPEGFTLKWYERFLENREYKTAIAVSLKIATLSVLVALLLGIPASYGIYRWKSPVSKVLSSLFLSPLMLPGIVWAIGLIQYYSIVNLTGTTAGLVPAHIILILPYVIRLVLSSLSYLDFDTVNAARTLGATSGKAFLKIVLPAIKPGVIISAIFGFMVSFNDVTISTFIAGTKNLTYPVRMYVELRTEGLDPLAVAVSAVIMAFTIVIALLAEKFWSWSKYL